MAYPNDSIEAVMELQRQRLSPDTRYDLNVKAGGYCAVCAAVVPISQQAEQWGERVYCKRHSRKKRGETDE